MSISRLQFIRNLQRINESTAVQEELFWRFKPLTRYTQVVTRYGVFSECACPDGEFNRHKTQRRQQIEFKIINQVKARFKRASLITYLSLGSGRLLQDFIICGKLLLAGYSLSVRLIDPCIHVDILKEFILQLTRFAKQLGCGFYVYYCKSVHDYHRQFPQELIHVAHAIDFDLALNPRSFSDLVCVQQLLHVNGFFYLAFNKYDYLFDRGSCIEHAYHGFNFFGFRPLLNRSEYQMCMTIPTINSQHQALRDTASTISRLPMCHINHIMSYAGLYSIDEKDRQDYTKKLK